MRYSGAVIVIPTRDRAELGLAQLERIEELIERKPEIFAWYKEELEGLEEVTMNYELPQARNSYILPSA